MGNFFKYFSIFLSLAPSVLQYVNKFHAEKDSATKVQLASEALAAASGIAVEVTPGNADHIAAVSDLAQAAINTVSSVYAAGHAAGVAGQPNGVTLQ